MKLLVFSDSHGEKKKMHQAISERNPDILVHLGDCSRDTSFIKKQFQIPLKSVRGNCDFASPQRDRDIFLVEGKKIFITHGHLYNVKSQLMTITMAGKEAQADIVMFGHTHQAFCEEIDGMYLFNPGSVGAGPMAGYGLVSIENGSIDCELIRC